MKDRRAGSAHFSRRTIRRRPSMYVKDVRAAHGHRRQGCRWQRAAWQPQAGRQGSRRQGATGGGAWQGTRGEPSHIMRSVQPMKQPGTYCVTTRMSWRSPRRSPRRSSVAAARELNTTMAVSSRSGGWNAELLLAADFGRRLVPLWHQAHVRECVSSSYGPLFQARVAGHAGRDKRSASFQCVTVRCR